ncbi:L-glutamyl-[BtrI acyl-carrier protein] decarboxylase [Anatilimnocola aggregata]|uniref:L-glutamyl-[BtrI acyl-carrier protein] decarboxylase n=1 Tax=Anatilimnocola aggregata TaxID=2528021 RepID=A0A517YBR1_9BACT|nr:type III PLP-dependent enzyme [Anatilimnocola aggregata]QDU27675.1 L-glutamyl-[BtrI acyl-carrier protein] decarboxylase [Anatilimnocola aggregata]
MAGVTTTTPATQTDHVADLIARHFGVSAGQLQVGGVAISELVRQFGSPLYVYDLDVARRQYQLLRQTLPPRFDICFSVKANPNQALLRTFVGQGSGLEIASSGELHQALAAGCPAHKILFAGPGKTEQELELALAQQIGEIHVESRTEARRLARLAELKHTRARISLRVNPAAAVEGGGMRMGAKAVPFGIDEDQLDDLLDELLPIPALEIVGLHLFVGTQILDHEQLLKQYRAGLEIARHLQQRLGRPLQTIDLGGGLGVPYFAHETRLDLCQLQVGLRAWMEEIARGAEFSEVRFVLEPGRFLAAEMGLYVTQVTDVKTSRGKKFAIVDGGMHHHLAASGNLGQTIKRNYPVAVLNKLDCVTTETIDVVGPLCTPLDVLARGLELPPIEIGDWIGVFQSGAYGRSASPLGFLSRQAPVEVVVERGVARLSRKRGTDHDYLADQLLCD